MTEPTGNPPPPDPAAPPPGPLDPEAPASWTDALGTLVSTRIALIKTEAGEAAGHAAKRAAAAAAAAVLALFFWVLLLAGGIGALAAATGWKWFWLTLAAAGLHALVILILLGFARKSTPSPFPVTRAEFEKDRQWLDRLKKQNSND